MSSQPVQKYFKRAAPAVRRFPVLQRLNPGLRPRQHNLPANPTIKVCRNNLRTMYHDLGVLVFAGVGTQQVNRIGDIIQDAMKPSLRFKAEPRHQSDAEFDKFHVYRLPTEDWHIDQSFKPKRGFLKVEGLLDLGLKAARLWAGHIKDKAKDIEALGENFGIQETDVNMTFDGKTRGGLIHHTVNGPRRLPVDAFVSASHKFSYYLKIQLFTVGTRRNVGNIYVSLLPFSQKNISTAKSSPHGGWRSEVNEIYNLAPNDETPDATLLKKITGDVYELEQERWKLEDELPSERKYKGPQFKAEKTEEAKAQSEETGEVEPQPEKTEAVDAQPENKHIDKEAGGVVDEAPKAEAEAEAEAEPKATNHEVSQATNPDQNSAEPPTKS
ncbi:hypothetical protein ACHAPT_006268 [Fusarium lateritium]